MRTTLPLLLLLAPAAAAAQVPGSSVRALGLAGAYSVSARGYEATGWNPANLTQPGRPTFTLGLPQVAFEFGSNSYGLGDFREYSGKTLSASDKTYLLGLIDTTLGVRSIVGVMPFGLSIGNFAFSTSVSGNLNAGLGKDAVELMLFGNAHRSGAGQFFTAAGSNADGWGAATIAASYAMPFTLPLGRLSVGVTGKYILGLGVARGHETQSQFAVNPAFQARVAGHAIFNDYANNTSAPPGHGIGMDVGGILELPGGLTVGATLVNLIGSMTWDEDRLRYERVDYQVSQNAAGVVTDTEVKTTLIGSAIDGDPVASALRDTLLAHGGFARVIRAGASLRFGKLLLAADGQLRLSEGLDRQPAQSLAVGAEYVLLGFLPLRVGLGSDFGDGLIYSAGTGLNLGPVKLDFGVANISGSDNPGVRVGVGFALMFGSSRTRVPVPEGYQPLQ